VRAVNSTTDRKPTQYFSRETLVNLQEFESTRTDTGVPATVAGWPLVLCVPLTFVYPATSFYSILWEMVPNLIDTHTTVRAILLGICFVLFVSIAVFGFSAGFKLWLIKPGAVGFARRYLLTYVGANVAYFVSWVLMVRPTHVASLAQTGWCQLVGPNTIRGSLVFLLGPFNAGTGDVSLG
jgi:hypothetical protein